VNADHSSLPVWSYPLLLVLLLLVLFVGRLPFALQAGVGVETVLFLVYLVVRSRRKPRTVRAPARLLPLFPGHLLLLLALSLVPAVGSDLVCLWMLVPGLSVLYDLLAPWAAHRPKTRVSLLTVLYCIIWADLFFLIERIIVLGRGLAGSGEIVVGAVFVLVGACFLFLGAYRHWRTSKV
jgi:hypothetical protein